MKKRYLVLGFIVLLSFFSPGLIIQDVILIYVFYLINQVEKKSNREQGLIKGEKVKVIITELFAPIIAGIFYYYCWKDTHPIKAKQARKYNWIIFSIQLIFLILILIAGYLVWLRGRFGS